MRLDLSGDGATPEGGLVRDAIAAVPVVRALGAGGVLSIDAVTGTASPDRFVVHVRAEGADRLDLFAETTEPWYLQVDSGTPDGDGRTTFGLRVLAGPKTPASVAVRLTLVAGPRAIDVTARLDGAASKP